MKRIDDHPVLGAISQEPVAIEFNAVDYPALAGDSVVSALLANGIRTLRRTRKSNSPRGVYCGIGHCFECRVTIDGISGVRACLTDVVDGMRITSEPGDTE